MSSGGETVLGRPRQHGKESTEVFEQSWHPDHCKCRQCHQARLHRHCHEQQVLSEFEDEIDRLEEEVRKSSVFSSTSQRYIDADWTLERQPSRDYTGKPMKEGSPSSEDDDDDNNDLARHSRPGHLHGRCLEDEIPHWDDLFTPQENLNGISDDVEFDDMPSSCRRSLMYDDDDEDNLNKQNYRSWRVGPPLLNGDRWNKDESETLEAREDEDYWHMGREGNDHYLDNYHYYPDNQHYHDNDHYLDNRQYLDNHPDLDNHHHYPNNYYQHSNNRYPPTDVLHTQASEVGDDSLNNSLHSEEWGGYGDHNQALYLQSVRPKKHKRKLTIRIKDTIKRRYH